MNFEIVSERINHFIDAFEIDKDKIPYILATIEAESNYQLVSESFKYTKSRFNQVFRSKYQKASIYCYDQPGKSERKLANIVYANRNGNGARNTGDGWRFRGQGFIQLTGRKNYSKINKEIIEAVNIDFNLELNPSLLVTSLDVSILTVLAYFKRVNLNQCNDMDCVTRLVNPWIGVKEYTRRRKILSKIQKRLRNECDK